MCTPWLRIIVFAVSSAIHKDSCVELPSFLHMSTTVDLLGGTMKENWFPQCWPLQRWVVTFKFLREQRWHNSGFQFNFSQRANDESVLPSFNNLWPIGYFYALNLGSWLQVRMEIKVKKGWLFKEKFLATFYNQLHYLIFLTQPFREGWSGTYSISY